MFNIDSEEESDPDVKVDPNENVLKKLTNKDIVNGKMFQIRNKKKLSTIA